MADSALTNELVSLERKLLSPDVRADVAQLRGLLADTFREFGASGRVYNKQDAVNALLSEPSLRVEVEIEDEEVSTIAPTVCLVTYTSVETTNEGVSRAKRSSIWKKFDESWKMVFHQGTRVENS